MGRWDGGSRAARHRLRCCSQLGGITEHKVEALCSEFTFDRFFPFENFVELDAVFLEHVARRGIAFFNEGVVRFFQTIARACNSSSFVI